MIRILIADSHAIVRSGLKQILEATTDIVIAGEAVQGSEVLEMLHAESVDLLTLEISTPGIDGIRLIRRIRARHPTLPVLVLSIHNEASVVSRALRAGASGYVTKESAPEVVITAIRKLASGGRFIDSRLADTVVFARHSIDAPTHEILTDREFQVLQMLAACRSNNEVAAKLVVSAQTISGHKRRLMKKLGLMSDAELFRYALRLGLSTG